MKINPLAWYQKNLMKLTKLKNEINSITKLDDSHLQKMLFKKLSAVTPHFLQHVFMPYKNMIKAAKSHYKITELQKIALKELVTFDRDKLHYH